MWDQGSLMGDYDLDDIFIITAWAAITKHQRLAGLNNRKHFLKVPGARHLRLRCQQN